MGKLVLIVCFALWQTFTTCMASVDAAQSSVNSSDTNKDMYVINAMVYQVGILTNKTDNGTNNYNTTGQQEALTLYHHNGTQVDLSQIPAPLLTNVTAQSIVGVAPVSNSPAAPATLPWSSLKHLTNVELPPSTQQESEQSSASRKAIRDVHSNLEDNEGIDLYKSLFKRDVSDEVQPVAVRKGTAVIPQTVGVQSLAIPPLLTLNNNLSHIPVPIPNTSLVHYAKINTLITKP